MIQHLHLVKKTVFSTKVSKIVSWKFSLELVVLAECSLEKYQFWIYFHANENLEKYKVFEIVTIFRNSWKFLS